MATIKKRSDFLAVRGGLRASTPAFLIEAKLRREGGHADAAANQARYGITVTKKLGNAVRRNRIRRRIRAALASSASGLYRPGYDYVFVARSPAFDRPFATMVEDLARAITQLHSPRTQKPRSGPEKIKT